MEEQGSSSRQSGSSPSSAGKGKSPGASGGKGRGRPRKSLFSPAATKKLGGALDIGHNVVVRWSDGLFYPGLVLRVDESNDRCQVRFEEGSTFYVLFKDIHKEPGQGEISCCVCKGETSDAPNKIVLCDNCELGVHQLCHNPPVINSTVYSRSKFYCQLCTYAASVMYDGTAPFTEYMPASDDIKQILPYKMNVLTWDAQHRTNVEQRYCYCGGPGDWYCKMLQCCRCRQWFHEACLQCLQHLLLYGDRFFMFVCSHCNQGQEYLKRLPFKWVDVVHLALFNLTLLHTYKYYDLDDSILPWIAEHLPTLCIDKLLEGKSIKSQEVRNKVETALMGHKSKFTSGREVKKKHTLWALHLRIPPNTPSVTVPLSGPINSDVLNNPNTKGRKMKHILPTQCLTPIPLKYPSRSSLPMNLSLMCRKTSACRMMPEANNNGLTNGISPKSGLTNTIGSVNGSSGSNSSNMQNSSCVSGQERELSPTRGKQKSVQRTDQEPLPHAARSSACDVKNSVTYNGKNTVTYNGKKGVPSDTKKAVTFDCKKTAITDAKKTLTNDFKKTFTNDFKKITTSAAKKIITNDGEKTSSNDTKKAVTNGTKKTCVDHVKKTVVGEVKNTVASDTQSKTVASDTQSNSSSIQSPSSIIPPTSSSISASGLNCLVPVLPNFEGVNHPFKTELEKEVEKAKLRHFENRMKFLTKEYAEELAAFKLAESTNHCNGDTKSVPSAKSPPTFPDQKHRKNGKRKRATTPEIECSPTDSVRRSKRSRVSVERYQHIPYTFLRHAPKPDPSESLAQRWKWLSVVDQLHYGEKFQIQARRTRTDGRVEFLLHWVENSDWHLGNS